MDHISTSELYWRHPEDEPPPKSRKILVYLNTGLTVIGDWREVDSLLWMPMPKVSKELKDR
jgi:hypothetical protein